MKTTLLTIDSEQPDSHAIDHAAKLIKAGNTVVFPTETVYGLGADALNPQAVRKIFKAKDRPDDNPLIVHVANPEDIEPLTHSVSKEAHAFIKAFWPGPLSLVLKKTEIVPPSTTANLNTVVIRCPNHPVAQALIKASETPLAAPSANLSGRISPTTASHAFADLNGRTSLIIDAGHIKYGLESTVVDCTGNQPVVLRPGSITLEMLQTIVPSTTLTAESTNKSPGMKYRHYAAVAPITLFTGPATKTAERIKSYLETNTKTTAVLWHTGDFSSHHINIKLDRNPMEAAPELFSSMHELDKPEIEEILIQGYEDTGIGVAIMNRLHKAATTIIDV
jgi:L-threonylcarbamoyladenylate synthase